MWRILKRILKWTGILAGVVVLVVVIGVMSIIMTVRSITGTTPGGLEVDPEPGPMGAMVNVFSGTGGIPYICPYDTPAATTPFGMVRLGPDTASILINQTGLNAAGYYYADNKIIGFSHTRLVGADCLEGGHLRIFPTVSSRVEEMRLEDRRTRFSHKEETAFPGYYAVRLPKEGVLAELTASPRVGVHRYTFTKDDDPHVLLDVTSAMEKRGREDGVVWVHPERQEVEGSVKTGGSFAGRYGGIEVFFVARFNKPFVSVGTWQGEQFHAGTAHAAGKDIGVDFTFAKEPGQTVVEVRLAISYVSIENARKNLEAEAAEKEFDALTIAARDLWEERLSTIRVLGGTTRQQRIFYTSMYHAFQMPTLFTDVNGEYKDFDKKKHAAVGFLYYTDFSLWDTFRTVHPLFSLIARDDQSDMMRSLLAMAQVGGCFPRWPSGCGYTNCMLGTPADIAVTEAYLKGIRGFDIEEAYGYLRRVALEGIPKDTKFAGREGLQDYLALGYCPSEKMSKSVARTLEFSHADYALSLLAEALGHEEDAAELRDNALSYKNTWNSVTQYFQPKDSRGIFSEDFDPLVLSYTDFDGKYTDDYVEGTALQWRWAVPFDADGLISLFESTDYFVSELEAFFENCDTEMGEWHPGSYYWHGNEPDLNAAYLFNSAGRPDLTQKWVRWILDTRYEDNHIGLDGNDDGGTLSAWYVLSAMGIYPVAGTTRYELGSPIFDRVDVDMGTAKLKITADNQGPGNLYVQKVELNGETLGRTWIVHDEIAEGGRLHFVMGSSPS